MDSKTSTTDFPDDGMVSEEDHVRITQAIRRAEKRTSGEIYAVVAHASDDYFYVAGFMAAVWSLLMALIMAAIAWTMAVPVSPFTIAAAQALALAVILMVFAFKPTWRLLFVPHGIAHRRASNNALRQFLAHGVHATQERSGILLFVSIAEHHAQVVADAGINEKVTQSDWDEIVVMLTSHAKRGKLSDGFLQAIERSADLLASHYPPSPNQQNELDDRLVEI
ncbi:MAG: TPM domain-containing protein [Pseudomonadota bacterium]